MAVRLTKHVETRVRERRLLLEWIEATITAPDWTAQDPDPALARSYKAISAARGRVLRVVHWSEGEDVIVVTAHFDRGAKP